MNDFDLQLENFSIFLDVPITMSPRAPGNNMNLPLHGAAAPAAPVGPASPAGPAPAPAFPASPFVPQQALLGDYQQDMAPQLDPSMSESPLSMKSEIMTPDVSMADLLSLPESMLPQSAIPTGNMQHNFMPDGTISNGIMPHDMISKGALPHDMISNGMVPDGTVPDMIDPQMNCLEGLQGLPGVPTYTGEYPSSNHEQAWFQCPPGGLGSSDLSRAQSLDIDSNSSGTIHPFGSMQAPLMGSTSPMPVQIRLQQHAPAPYPMSPRPGSNRITRNNRNNRNRYTPAQYGRGISDPVSGLESHASPRTNAELEQEARHAQRRKSHNYVEKRYRIGLNVKYIQLDSAINSSVCSFPAAGGSCPGSGDKMHSKIAPSDREAEEILKQKGSQRVSRSKAGILAGAIARMQQMADEIHMLKLKVAMCEASRAADSQQVHDGVDAVHGDEDKDAPHDVEGV